MSKGFLLESDVENLALDTLERVGYQVYKSPSPTSPNPEIDAMRGNNHDVAILTEILDQNLRRINSGLTDEVYREAIRQITRLADNPDMMINNHYFHNLLIEGIRVKTTINGENRTEVLYPIDFDHVEKNDFTATNQFTFKGSNERRPDTTIFVNGLPVVTFEFKDASNPNVSIENAYRQLQTYKAEIPEYLKYNEILIASDGINSRAGSLTAGFDRFMRWRAPKDISDSDDLELETMIKYMLSPKDLLNLIENFIIFETDGDSTVKILAAYHQYYMVNKAVQAAKRTLTDPDDKRIGVVWHTTGSGKSLSMVFFSSIVARKLNNPTILVINDRNDLDDQLFDTFAAAHEFLRQNPEHAETSEELRHFMDKQAGGIVFSTIQKFSPDFEKGETEMPVLTNRSDVIVIADEAHRSQYGLTAQITDNGLRYGYAKYLRDALPNAAFIGFTGTPISTADKSTVAVFGNYIDVYDITQAVNDHATVKIYYESHVFPLKLKKDAQQKYQALLKEADLNDDPNLDENARRNREFSRLEALAGAQPRLQSIAQHFVNHFEARQKEAFGKAMIVEMSRRNAVRLYNEIIKLRPEWDSDDLNKGKIKVVMTSSAADGPEMAKFQTSKADRRVLQKRMKDNNDELQIVIVVDMWLTGFDVPSMNTMYIDKPMKGHNLIQAIARVNRVFKDKNSALIVDYIGIAENLRDALNVYSTEDQGQVGINMNKALALLKEKYDIITNDFLYGVDYSGYDSDNSTTRLKVTRRVANEILHEDEETQRKFLDVVTELQKAFALTSTQPEAQAYGKDIAFFKTVKVFIQKLKQPDTQPGKKEHIDVKYQMQQLLDQSIISEPDVDIYNELGIERQSIDLISDKFLQKVGNMPEQDVAITLLEKLLKGKIKAMVKTNKVTSGKFEDMLKKSIDEYNKRGITSELIIRKLIDMAKKINAEQEKGKDLGLSPEEVAFYDALADHEKAVEVLGEEKLHLIAQELVKLVKEGAGVDWEKRRNIQAKMRVAVKHLLRKYGYPPDIAPEVVNIVVEQAELMASND
ncbi:type I restriction endonuclease subunit R [Pediococcus acidilactici]|uniref:type I restriction endonuclease subunit R n=1 Tax=Pediococcus acidilactici TaxID=1254 RepID=UPI001F4E0054|nr:type I restriction endonuclease subunit R [Pediococcus acidilactici]MCH9266139.1 type I restriction endonuclease subunit R [Pediococcus acidilactici]MCK2074886.1 type I restriction endonuclease subunit R [Pediococcus acidilactici]MDV2602878.1 type I restriction endonuclease subunit R [Pediococcus acidilactici]MDV2844300.1 type I restriction endonuclease subunit R [Pediococcus acidilactici]WQS21978.1 type I restriction endonuclease subunit R [Pediococcus acidilactici]